jgi:hypothetical protein
VETSAAFESPTDAALIAEIKATLLSLIVSTSAAATVRCSGLFSTGFTFMSSAAVVRAVMGDTDLAFEAGLPWPPPPPIDPGSSGKIVTRMASA